MKIDALKDYTKNLIVKYEKFSYDKYLKNTFHLNYTSTHYRQDDLVALIRDSVRYFALTEEEFLDLEDIEKSRTAWSRISKARKDKKGDYGEFLLYLILLVFYDAPKFVTKVRLRSSTKMQVNGYDCAHFTIEADEPVLWLGESKFHQSFSNALTDAINSLNEHCNILYTTDEFSILRPNIEANKNDTDFVKLQSLFRGKSFDNIRFRIPVLLTYDSSVVQNNSDVDKKFNDELEVELEDLYKKIEKKEIKTDLKNIEFVFMLFPFDTVAKIKDDLELIEKVMQL